MRHDLAMSRRAALQGGAGLVIALALPLGGLRAQGAAAKVDPNAFLRIGTDDSVTVFAKHLEMGQGPFTGLATLVAEELDADWAQIRVEHAPADAALYGNKVFGGLQGTGGSSAISNSYDQMRQAGAAARAMLVSAAARQWRVAPAEISVADGVIRHDKSKREGRFGAFAAAAAKLPIPPQVKLKDSSAFRLIGKDHGVRRPDSVAKSTGKANFTIDLHDPKMLTVVVARPPAFGARVASFDAAEALKVKGVTMVKQVPSGVAVFARGSWPAIKARKLLRIEWDESAAEKRSSDQIIADYRRLADTPGKVAGKQGDAAAALARGGKIFEADYVFPYLAHGPMEPLDGVLTWNAGGAKARFGSQIQTLDQATIARLLGLKPEQVAIETVIAGGSFGRRAQADTELAAELAEVAKAAGPDQPVKLIRTREDDLHGGYYRPLVVHRLKGAVRDGKIVAWSNRIVGQSIMAGTPFEGAMKDGIDPTLVEGARALPYDIPDFLCDIHVPKSPVPVLWWRSVGHTHTGYAVECFVDELLAAAGQDPVDGRLAMMAKAPRAAGVLRAVAKAAGWPAKPAQGRARGVAVVESFSSYVAQIAEVSVGENGEPRVHKIWCAVDCGVAVNPDVIRAQMEGGIGYGLGHALYAEIPLTRGRAAVGNFDEYRSLRIMEMPEVEVVIVPSAEPPTGVGEPGVPPVAPAVANALAALGRERPKRLPMVGRA